MRSTADCPIVELRQYALRPGMRETLIELFEREFIESQEALGVTLFGQFRAAEDPNRFVWLRGFPDMEVRRRALAAFYGGPVWRAHRDAANATMLDSDNVLLLRPARPGSGFALSDVERPAPGTMPSVSRPLRVSVYSSDRALPAAEVEQVEELFAPERAAGSLLASFVTLEEPNNFPALPVRENEHVYVAFETLAGGASGKFAAALAHRVAAPPEVWTLAPTPRSRIR
jgi:NIPSNAP